MTAEDQDAIIGRPKLEQQAKAFGLWPGHTPLAHYPIRCAKPPVIPRLCAQCRASDCSSTPSK
jgi:hypothetical protein